MSELFSYEKRSFSITLTAGSIFDLIDEKIFFCFQYRRRINSQSYFQLGSPRPRPRVSRTFNI